MAHEIARMALIRGNQPQPVGPFGTTGGMIVLPPDLERALRYYERLARRGCPPSAPDGPAVANVRLFDVDGDGTLNLAVAAFGWRKVGGLTVLENHTTDYAHPSLIPRLIDPRPGAIHAIPVDLNKDEKMDLVVVFAQQFETVVVFMNNGGTEVSFTPQVIYTGPSQLGLVWLEQTKRGVVVRHTPEMGDPPPRQLCRRRLGSRWRHRHRDRQLRDEAESDELGGGVGEPPDRHRWGAELHPAFSA